MRSLDDMLAGLGQMPVPELASLDDAVMAGLARRRQEAAFTPGLMGAAGGLALVLGLAGGSLSYSDPALARPLTPFASADALAPSTLLAVHP
ncbi:MAG: hypothetical protein AB7F98_15005 [Novosphingobium sp.]